MLETGSTIESTVGLYLELTPFHVFLISYDNLGTWPPMVRATYP